MPSTFRLVTRARIPADQLFDVSLDIDAHVVSMRGTAEQAIAGVTTGRIGLGESVTWRARHFGLWFRMTSRITTLDRPHRFVDEQTRGPFRVFRHEHEFAQVGEETVMTDTLTVGSPVFGAVAERAVLVPYLRRLIRIRNASLLASLGLAGGTEPAQSEWSDDTGRYRRHETTAVIGHGARVWERAAHDVLRWAVKTRSGFEVDSREPVGPGERVVVTARVAGITIREPVLVRDVVIADDRVGFSYRTLPGHPVSGEEAFVVHRVGDEVSLTIRSLTAPAERGAWRMLFPVLLVAQAIVRRRYLRALR